MKRCVGSVIARERRRLSASSYCPNHVGGRLLPSCFVCQLVPSDLATARNLASRDCGSRADLPIAIEFRGPNRL